MMRKKWINLFVCSLLISCAFAQTDGYKFYSPLDSVKIAGFYNIALTPALNAHLKTDYSDVRVVNDDGKWVPHLLRLAANQRKKNTVSAFVEIIKKSNSGFFTELILKNNSTFLSDFNIQIKNTTANRIAKLSGSDNLTDWFVIKDSVSLEPVASEAKDKSQYQINFPSCNYKFYKVLVDNKKNDPVNILSVTHNVDLTFYNVNIISNNPGCILQQKDSGKTSYIKITQQEAFHFEYFKLKISGVKYFYRRVDIYLPNDENHSFSKPGNFYQSFYISNNSALEFNIPLTNAKAFYLLIYNEDNLPLKVDEVKTWSNLRSITTYLEKGNVYKLALDNPIAVAPNYDLTNLTKTIPDSAASLTAGKIMAFKQNEIATAPAKNNKWMLWAALIAALFILLLFTQKMIKEVNKRKQDDSI